jgi:hypothetical protein
MCQIISWLDAIVRHGLESIYRACVAASLSCFLLCCRAVPQTISDMVIYNRSRRDARRRFKMRNMKERQMMKFKVGKLLQLSVNSHDIKS